MNHEPSIGAILRQQRSIYLNKRKEGGGTAEGFRDYIAKWQAKDPQLLEKWAFEALMEATTKAWQAPPKKSGPDLFSINEVEIQDHLTRPTAAYANGENIEDDEEKKFEKVSATYATVNDFYQDAQIKYRKAGQSIAAAERQMKAVDEARKRAKGDMSVHLKDIKD